MHKFVVERTMWFRDCPIYFRPEVLRLLEKASTTIGDLEVRAHDACQHALDRASSADEVIVLPEDVFAGFLRDS